LNPRFHIALGDLKYKEFLIEEEWCDMVANHIKKVPFVLLAGNHESSGADGHIKKFAHCFPYPLKEKITGEYTRNFSFDYPIENPQARFILISPNIRFGDTTDEYYAGTPLMNELTEKIKDAKTKNIPWIIVAGHKPCLTTEYWHTCETGTDLPKELISQGVDLYINGHAHLYQRTYALSCFDEKKINDTCIKKGTDNVFKKGEGTIFITAGTGGVNLRDMVPGSVLYPYFASIHAANKDPIYGVSYAQLTSDTLKIDFINALDKQVVDSFVIKKDK
jgi:hypothetical protein